MTRCKKSANISYLTSNNAFTQRIFFCDIDHTAIEHACTILHSVYPASTNHSNIDLIHCDQREHELYQLWNEVPSQDTILSQDNRLFLSTRSVRLYHTCCTKYISVAQQSDNLLISLRTEFAESCAWRPRAKWFSTFSGADTAKKCYFIAIFYYFFLFLIVSSHLHYKIAYSYTWRP